MPVGGYLGEATKKTGTYIDERNPWVDTKSSDAKKASKKAADEWYEKTQGINKKAGEIDAASVHGTKTAGNSYLYGSKSVLDKYIKDTTDLSNEAKQQSKDATATYTNTILPQFKGIMESAKANASGAMTLQEAMDPNNAVMKGVRDLYDKQGQQARLQGQQDFGILSGLGAQATGQQLGAAGPMTAGAMGQISAANQAQAGDAYARAQQRMYDLQQQGLNKSFDQSNLMYNLGQEAQDRYGNTVKDIQDSQAGYYGMQGDFRDEIGGYAGDQAAAKHGYEQDRYGVGLMNTAAAKGAGYAGLGRDQGAINQVHGVEQAGIQGQQEAQLGQKNATGQGIMSAAMLAALMMSDENEKHAISSVSDSELDEFLTAVKPAMFNYKDTSKPGTADGRRIGFMLQDVQGTKLGKAMTRRGPKGELMYDKDNLSGILLAGLARQAKRRKAG